MARTTENKIVLVVRKTRLENLLMTQNTVGQAKFYVEHLGADFSDYENEDQQYQDDLKQAHNRLANLGRVQVLQREFAPNYVFGPKDVVVVLGQDGLVANILKYLDNQPVIGVNPDPSRWEGTLTPFEVKDLPSLLPEVFAGRRPINRVTMAKAELNTGEVLYGVNDLFIGPKNHSSARYSLDFAGRRENHSSSGVIVSTGLGSTGWMRSIIAGANNISQFVNPEHQKRPSSIKKLTKGKKKAEKKLSHAFSWDDKRLFFSVREPWPSTTTKADITCGYVTPNAPLILESSMAENGIIFSDGMQADYIDFLSGTKVVISIADKEGHLVG